MRPEKNSTSNKEACKDMQNKPKKKTEHSFTYIQCDSVLDVIKRQRPLTHHDSAKSVTYIFTFTHVTYISPFYFTMGFLKCESFNAHVLMEDLVLDFDGVLVRLHADNIRLAAVTKEREQVVLLVESCWFSPCGFETWCGNWTHTT